MDMQRAISLTRTHTVFVAYDAEGEPIGYGFDRKFAGRLSGCTSVRKLPANAWKHATPAMRNPQRCASLASI